MTKAPRRLLHSLHSAARGAVLAFVAVALMPKDAAACTISPLAHADVVQSSVVQKGDVRAWYSGLTDRYAHGVLGDALEPTRLHLLTPATSAQCGLRVTLDPPFVFEDIAPRLFDVTGDGQPELIVVRSHANKGAQLAIYGQVKNRLKLIAATPFIGTRNRWLAPVGAADLDGDGQIEIAYIDRPHLAKTLRIWRFSQGDLTPVVDVTGLTNHRIGEDFISGGISHCNDTPEMILADASWRRIIAVSLTPGKVTQRDLGAFSPQALSKALTCS